MVLELCGTVKSRKDFVMRKELDVLGFFHDRPRLSILMGVVIFISGILISDLPRMIVSSGWPTTDGKVVSRQFAAQRFKEYDGDFYTNIDGFVRYEYVVEGISYTSLSINSIDTNFYPYNIAKEYPPGKDVTVYYNPKDPSDTVLEPGFVGIFETFDVFSYLLFGAGIYFTYTGLSRIKKNAASGSEINF